MSKRYIGPRERYNDGGPYQDKTCGGCGCREGKIHSPGCDHEECPFCGGQLICCGCCYEQLGYDYEWDTPMCGLPQEIYEEGLGPDEQKEWEEILEKKGRIPYIQWPNMCGYCGERWPAMFMVPDREWEKYVAPRNRREMLCEKCYDYIKDLIDRGEESTQVL